MPVGLLPLIAVLLIAPSAMAQISPAESAEPLGLDRELLLAIYTQDQPLVDTAMRGVDWSSTRVVLASGPALAGGILLFGDAPQDLGSPYRLALSQAGTMALVYALKYSVRRDRPYVEDLVVSRSERYSPATPSYSFPSGHAALAAATATSLSLSYPEWWVIVPSALWAGAVTLSRPWLGVHYPSDVAAGALLGAGVAIVVHLARDAITPQALSPLESASATLPLLRIQW